MDLALLILTFGGVVFAGVGATVAVVQARSAAEARDDAERAAARAVAAAEGSAEALREANRLTMERVPDQTQVAYKDLLRVMSELVSHTFLDESGPGLLRDLRLQMTFLAELYDEHPELADWFDAERELALRLAIEASEGVMKIKDLDQTTQADLALPSEPFNRWGANFTNNLRAWRQGIAPRDLITARTSSIRAELEARGAWHEPLAWRLVEQNNRAVNTAFSPVGGARESREPWAFEALSDKNSDQLWQAVNRTGERVTSVTLGTPNGVDEQWIQPFNEEPADLDEGESIQFRFVRRLTSPASAVVWLMWVPADGSAMQKFPYTIR